MKVELKDVLQYLGIEKEPETIDEFRDAFGKEFLRKQQAIKDPEIVNTVIGTRMGSIETAVKRLARENGIELSAEAITGKKVEDILGHVEKEIKNVYTGKISELEKQLASNDKEEVVKTWQEKYSKLENKYKDTESLVGSLRADLDNEKKNAQGIVKGFKLDSVKKSAFSSIPFKEGVKEIELRGFRSMVDEKYIIDLDEKDEPFIADRKTGSRIENKKVNGTFMSIEDVLKEEAVKAELFKVADAGNNKTPKFVSRNPVQVSMDAGAQTGNVPSNPRRTTYRDRTGK